MSEVRVSWFGCKHWSRSLRRGAICRAAKFWRPHGANNYWCFRWVHGRIGLPLKPPMGVRLFITNTEVMNHNLVEKMGCKCCWICFHWLFRFNTMSKVFAGRSAVEILITLVRLEKEKACKLISKHVLQNWSVKSVMGSFDETELSVKFIALSSKKRHNVICTQFELWPCFSTVTGCCAAGGVSSTCQQLCTYDVDVLSAISTSVIISCSSYLRTAVACATGL
jgi:hypothetical protein